MQANHKFKIYTVSSYGNMSYKDFENNLLEYDNIQDIVKELDENDGAYHFRVLPKSTYIFFGDLDYYNNSIECFIGILQKFLKKKYNLEFIIEEFVYTQNESKNGSYHYSIPKWHLTTEALKEIHLQLIAQYHNEFIINDLNGRQIKVVDTSIYSNHWFRCPNQTKGNVNNDGCSAIHKIIKGEMINFIIDYIPDNSTNINSIIFNEKNNKDKDNEDKQIVLVQPIQNYSNTNIVATESNTSNNQTNRNNENILSTIMKNSQIYIKLFDECYKKFRFDNYDDWIKVGMAIKNTITDEKEALKLFIYFSSKSAKYDGDEITVKKFNSFKLVNNGLTAKTLYKMAYEDNKEKTIIIMSNNTLQLSPTDIAQFIKILSGKYFFYKITSTNQKNSYKLYCYNGKYWTNDTVPLKAYISTYLYDFIKDLLCDVYWNQNSKEFQQLKNTLEKLKTISAKQEIIETYKEYNSRNDINFDDKWWLFGFTNIVYDMKECIFREYIPEDYISITCGYEWREPTQDELDTINNLINIIMPNADDKITLLQILSTGIDGRPLEKFNIFNGYGRNGKGFIDDLALTTVGNYGMIGNNNILFEVSKMGSNPEKANMDKKRLVILREPPKHKKFENSIIKELTGGGKFSARSHFESDTEKELCATIICECNDKPLFNEPITNGEIQRVIDVLFKSTFTKDDTLIDHSKYIYKGNDFYKTNEFKNQYKFAFFKILTDYHKQYHFFQNDSIKLSNDILIRTNKYLEESCDIVEWFKENYSNNIIDEDNTNIVFLKIGDIYKTFRESEFYNNLTKTNKEKYTKTKFFDFIRNNIFFKKYYHEHYGNNHRILLGWYQNIEEYDMN